MELDATLLMVSLIPSGIGFVLFTYGRKEHRWYDDRGRLGGQLKTGH